MLSKFKAFYERHERIALILFFVGGFIWDSLTLQRIDHLYSNFVLFTYLLGLMASLYIFNLTDDGRWKKTFLEPYEEYAPLAVQFFLGGLSSAYVVFFFRSVSLTKTMVFFFILIFLMISNELFKHRISNKYLQFSAFYFINFTFFVFMIPVFTGIMNTMVFIISGGVALAFSSFFILFVYSKSPSTQREIKLLKLCGIVLVIYMSVNVFYYFNLIPPVPLSLKTGLVAYSVEKSESSYLVTYDPDKSYKIWKAFNPNIAYAPGDTIFAYTSIFAPTNLNKGVAHRWKWLDRQTGQWRISDIIDYKIEGGRDGGYRGFTFKTNLHPGQWEIDVITEEGLIIGTMDFNLIQDSSFSKEKLRTNQF